MRAKRSSASRGLLGAVGTVSFITLLSRIFGYIRDRIVAFYLGTAFGADAFYLIFAIPNTFRRLVGEGAMSSAFIPVFSDYLENKGKKESVALANRAFYLLSIILLVITVLGVIFSAQILSLTDFRDKHGADAFELAIRLNMIIFPYVFFICLSALLTGMLNSHNIFAAPAFTPVLLNLSIITAGLAFASKASNPAIPLAWGILIGGVIQLAFLVPFAVRKGMTFVPSLGFTDPGILRMWKLLVPTIFGAGIYQINVLIVRFVASHIYEGSVSSLYYSSRIMEFALGIYAISVATVILPRMSKQGAKGDLEALSGTLSFGLRIVSYVCIPASAGMILLSRPIVDVLFRGGEYTAESARLTSQALTAYSAGLLAIAGSGILVRAFYALKDTKTPVIAATWSFMVNLVLISVLIGPFGHVGLAAASTGAAFVNGIFLAVIFIRKMTAIDLAGLGDSLARIFSATGVMCAVVYLFARFSGIETVESMKVKGVLLLFAVTAGVAAFVISSAAVRSPEFSELVESIRSKGKK